VGDFASFAKIFAGFYFGRGIEVINLVEQKCLELKLKGYV